MKAILLLFFLVSFSAFSQSPKHQVGFKIIRAYDSTRLYKPGTSSEHVLHYRPIDIDLWYPADLAITDTTASFGDLVNLLEKRSMYYDDQGDYRGLSKEMLQYICAGVACNDYHDLESIETNSFVDAKIAIGEFPLIIYLCAFNGMSYENYHLFETLAQNGFVVASVSSIGRYPGNMTMDIQDLNEQVDDARFIIRKLGREINVSTEVGLVGYSWGGLAASIIGMTDPQLVKAIVSLDGSEQLTYNHDETEKLLAIRNDQRFNPLAIRAPFLYLDSDYFDPDNASDSIYNFIDHIPGDKCYLKIKGSAHEDFSSLSYLSKEGGVNTRHRMIEQLTVDYFLDKILGQNHFQEKIPASMVARDFIPHANGGERNVTSLWINGAVRDKKTNQPLPYVNLGIVNGDRGTTTNEEGQFRLRLDSLNLVDTLGISMVGYESRSFPVNKLYQEHASPLTIFLQESVGELKEVIVIDKKLVSKTLGNKTDSKFFGGKFASDDLGSEIAIKIKIRKDPTYLDKFSFNISYNTADTVKFRVNIYDAENGLPGKNILQENVVLTVHGNTGKVDVDLMKYNLAVKEDIFISLEWIEGKQNSGVVFSAGLLNNATYYRKASLGRWRKSKMGVGFNVSVKY